MSSTADPRLRVRLLLFCALAAGCGEPAREVAARVGGDGRKAGAPPATPDPARRGASLREAFRRDLAAAVAGRPERAPPPAGAFGMACAPARVTSRAPAMTIELPADPALRRNVLAVVTPERGLLEIYSPYGDETEAEDVLVPSDLISWAEARTRRRFALGAHELQGLRRGAEDTEPVFIEAGRYRFALVNGIDARLLAANGSAVRVIAGCSFSWTPETAGPPAAR